MFRPKVSIGIPAYNEEANIKDLVESLFAQKQKSFSLHEIIVVSDASDDNTVAKVKEISDNRLVVFENTTRMGKALSQNKVIDLFTGDLLAMFDADILIRDRYFLNKLIRPFRQDKNIGIVSPKIIPLPPNNFFEGVMNCGAHLRQEVFEASNEGNNMGLCYGRARVFSKKMAEKILWPQVYGEDSYSYLTCVKEKYTFTFNPSAVAYYRSPGNLRDHFKQSARASFVPQMLSQYFSMELVKKETAGMGKLRMVKIMLTFLLKNPILFASYIMVFLYTRMHPGRKKHATALWNVSQSSKFLTGK